MLGVPVIHTHAGRLVPLCGGPTCRFANSSVRPLSVIFCDVYQFQDCIISANDNAHASALVQQHCDEALCTLRVE